MEPLRGDLASRRLATAVCSPLGYLRIPPPSRISEQMRSHSRERLSPGPRPRANRGCAECGRELDPAAGSDLGVRDLRAPRGYILGVRRRGNGPDRYGFAGAHDGGQGSAAGQLRDVPPRGAADGNRVGEADAGPEIGRAAWRERV